MWYSNLSSYIPDGAIVKGLFSSEEGYTKFMKRNDVKIKLLYLLCLVYVIWTIVKMYITVSKMNKKVKDVAGLFSGKVAPPFVIIQLFFAIRLSQYLGTVAVTNNNITTGGSLMLNISAMTPQEYAQFKVLKDLVVEVKNMKPGVDLKSPLDVENLKKIYPNTTMDLNKESDDTNDTNKEEENDNFNTRKAAALLFIKDKAKATTLPSQTYKNLEDAIMLASDKLDSQQNLATRGLDTHMFHEVANISLLMATLTLSLFLLKQIDGKTFWIEFSFATVIYVLSRNLFIGTYNMMMDFLYPKCYQITDLEKCKKDTNCIVTGEMFCEDYSSVEAICADRIKNNASPTKSACETSDNLCKFTEKTGAGESEKPATCKPKSS